MDAHGPLLGPASLNLGGLAFHARMSTCSSVVIQSHGTDRCLIATSQARLASGAGELSTAAAKLTIAAKTGVDGCLEATTIS